MVLTHDMLFKGNFNYIVTYSKVMLLLLLSHPVMSDPLWPHGLHHIRPSCPSPSPGVCPSLCSLHQWCHPTISSSDALFPLCPWSFPSSGTFPVSHLFISDNWNTGASASVLPVNIQGWSPLRLTGLILLSRELSWVFSSTTLWRHHLYLSLIYWHINMCRKVHKFKKCIWIQKHILT